MQQMEEEAGLQRGRRPSLEVLWPLVIPPIGQYGDTVEGKGMRPNSLLRVTLGGISPPP